MPKSHYKTLELPNFSSIAEVKKAYRRLAKKYHPDLNKGNGSERFREITAAYEALIDITAKTQHDLDLRAAQQQSSEAVFDVYQRYRANSSQTPQPDDDIDPIHVDSPKPPPAATRSHSRPLIELNVNIPLILVILVCLKGFFHQLNQSTANLPKANVQHAEAQHAEVKTERPERAKKTRIARTPVAAKSHSTQPLSQAQPASDIEQPNALKQLNDMIEAEDWAGAFDLSASLLRTETEPDRVDYWQYFNMVASFKLGDLATAKEGFTAIYRRWDEPLPFNPKAKAVIMLTGVEIAIRQEDVSLIEEIREDAVIAAAADEYFRKRVAEALKAADTLAH